MSSKDKPAFVDDGGAPHSGFRFKSEDFRHLECCDSFFPGEVSTIANQLLDEYVQSLPEVFSHYRNGEMVYAQKGFARDGAHRARLWGVEEIKQKKCEPHEMHVTFVDGLPSHGRCNKCGKRLVAKWEEG